MAILERDLRVFVKNSFEENSNASETLFFVEAGKGGSEGMADVFWPYDKQLIPIELKIFRDGFFLRPSQYSFHRNCRIMQIPSFVVGAIPCDDPDDNKIIFIDGKYIDWFRDLSKEEFYSLDNKKSDNCFWILETNTKENYYDVKYRQNKKMFREAFFNILNIMIEDVLKKYK